MYKFVDEASSLNSGCESINFSQFNEPLADKRIFDFISIQKKTNICKINLKLPALRKSKSFKRYGKSSPRSVILVCPYIDKNFEVRGTNMSYKKYKEIIFRLLSNLKFKNCKEFMDMACNFLNHKKS